MNLFKRLKEIWNYKEPIQKSMEYKCACCSNPVKQGQGGALFEGVPFCFACKITFKHFDYFEMAGLNETEIYLIREIEI